MEQTELIYYRIKRYLTDEEAVAYRAVVLMPGSNVPVEKTPREKAYEVIADMTRGYVEQIVRVSSELFAEILQQRTTHSAEMLALLESTVMGDLRSYHVYGSHRPIDGFWARIPDAVYILVPGWPGYGHHTYVATPLPMEQAVQASYELIFISRPATEEQMDID
jgi:hypothetical protein